MGRTRLEVGPDGVRQLGRRAAAIRWSQVRQAVVTTELASGPDGWVWGDGISLRGDAYATIYPEAFGDDAVADVETALEMHGITLES